MATDDDELRWKVSPDWVYQRFHEVGRDPQRPRPFLFGWNPDEPAHTVDADPPRLAQIAPPPDGDGDEKKERTQP